MLSAGLSDKTCSNDTKNNTAEKIFEQIDKTVKKSFIFHSIHITL